MDFLCEILQHIKSSFVLNYLLVFLGFSQQIKVKIISEELAYNKVSHLQILCTMS